MANGRQDDDVSDDNLICTTLGNGAKMPRMGFWDSLSRSPARDVEKALQSGYRHVLISHNPLHDPDIALTLARWTKNNKPGHSRDQLFIALTYDLGPTAGLTSVRQQINSRIQTLECRYIDMVILHRPDAHKIGDSLRQKNSVTNAWKGLEKLVTEKNIRSLSLCNFHQEDVTSILTSCTIQPDVLWVSGEPKILGWLDLDHARRYCQYKGLRLGLLHRIDRPDTEWVRCHSTTLATLAKKHNRTPIQIFHRLLIQKEILVSVAVDNRTIESSFRIFDFHLSQEDVKDLNNLTL